MNRQLQTHLETQAEQLIDNQDAAHDFEHARRVMHNAVRIGAAEGGNPDILVPAALFHDVVMYPKNDPRSAKAATQSADTAARILREMTNFPQDKIEDVIEAISYCSFHHGPDGLGLNSLILQDADRLEATGAIAIMRTFWSAGHMGQPLYNPSNPLSNLENADGLRYAFDLFHTRLLRVEERMNTQTGRNLARSRGAFLRSFVMQFQAELGISGAKTGILPANDYDPDP